MLYGKEFAAASYPFWYLAPGIVLLSIGRIYSTYLIGVGKAFYAFYFSIFTLILNIVLNFILIPLVGINGSALATSISYTFQAIVMYLAFSHESKIPVRELVMLCREDFDVYRRGICELQKYLKRK
jgi:O-antigen/teichoic acid export membrane protein